MNVRLPPSFSPTVIQPSLPVIPAAAPVTPPAVAQAPITSGYTKTEKPPLLDPNLGVPGRGAGRSKIANVLRAIGEGVLEAVTFGLAKTHVGRDRPLGTVEEQRAFGRQLVADHPENLVTSEIWSTLVQGPGFDREQALTEYFVGLGYDPKVSAATAREVERGIKETIDLEATPKIAAARAQQLGEPWQTYASGGLSKPESEALLYAMAAVQSSALPQPTGDLLALYNVGFMAVASGFIDAPALAHFLTAASALPADELKRLATACAIDLKDDETQTLLQAIAVMEHNGLSSADPKERAGAITRVEAAAKDLPAAMKDARAKAAAVGAAKAAELTPSIGAELAAKAGEKARLQALPGLQREILIRGDVGLEMKTILLGKLRVEVRFHPGVSSQERDACVAKLQAAFKAWPLADAFVALPRGAGEGALSVQILAKESIELGARGPVRSPTANFVGKFTNKTDVLRLSVDGAGSERDIMHELWHAFSDAAAPDGASRSVSALLGVVNDEAIKAPLYEHFKQRRAAFEKAVKHSDAEAIATGSVSAYAAMGGIGRDGVSALEEYIAESLTAYLVDPAAVRAVDPELARVLDAAIVKLKAGDVEGAKKILLAF